ncbi:hypothetical protein BU23DRAFT_627728 [Bimuria novae-zelandiae CBS 107.79]|uniref:Uncharacterized protein n=1 Tax=Bimuria novae-zelandiae CBS 107.79 TaxID=1447943 RepID=A0A6A5UNE3_9PLEO|nr:hypothetical protein BU23DRAFT_627728 [Bimuria novae-zelandiae CBS 107.79]
MRAGHVSTFRASQYIRKNFIRMACRELAASSDDEESDIDIPWIPVYAKSTGLAGKSLEQLKIDRLEEALKKETRQRMRAERAFKATRALLLQERRDHRKKREMWAGEKSSLECKLTQKKKRRQSKTALNCVGDSYGCEDLIVEETGLTSAD